MRPVKELIYTKILLGHFKLILSISIFLVLLSSPAAAAEKEIPVFNPEARFHPVAAQNGMVVSEERYATEAGLAVLMEGGNAVDAAVTVGFTLAVTYPRAGNLGGGGFMLIYIADKKEIIAVDYREKAPMAARAEMYLDEEGRVDGEKSRRSILAAGVPGTVAGLAIALEEYGTISLKRAIRPAIELAEKGFPVNEELGRSLLQARDRMRSSDESMAVFFKEGGEPYADGEILIQKNLAESLKEISKNGPDAFYKGSIAEENSLVHEREGRAHN